MTGTHSLLKAFPAVCTISVQWGEMDAYGHVNNAVFFRYFETARIAYLERCGFTQSWNEHRIGAILHSTTCRFRQALFYPDTVQVGGRATEMNSDRFTMEYHVVSLGHDVLVAEGTGVIVSFDYARREKTEIPAEVREAIRRLEGWD